MNKILVYTLRVFIFTFSILSFSLPALSANLAFMNDTASQYFKDQDWKMFKASADHALNTLPNGKSETWRNAKTGNGGSFMPLNSIRKNGTVCRNLRITNRAQHRTDQYVFMYCKFRTGWKIQK